MYLFSKELTLGTMRGCDEGDKAFFAINHLG